MYRQLLSVAMQSPDELVLSLEYVDSKGVKTRRIVSPIRFLASGRFLGLCLCRCEPRQFHLERCSNLKLCRASDYLMPVPMESAT
jgi:predicted DNA-binding transcriptional regulator YafY